MRLSFTWQQLGRVAVTVCLTAFIIVHSFVQQSTPLPASSGTHKQQKATNPVKSWTLLPAQRSFAQFEAGMIFPHWGVTAYSRDDTNWLAGLHEIQAQTGARWVAMTIALRQANQYATQVKTSPDTPTPESLAEGIRAAKQLGYRVFIIPMITLDSNLQWSGYISFATLSQAQAWFDSYWQTLRPYILVAQKEKAEQFSLGNELEGLQTMPAPLWQQLLGRVMDIYTGNVVYDMNWTSLGRSIPSWMDDQHIAAIGISTYIPLTKQAQRLDGPQLPILWHERVGSVLDAFAEQLGKPLFISELGYRDTAFAGYNPWKIQVNEPQDDSEQAALFAAALQNIANDTLISGVFIWAWSFPPFAPNGKPAAQVIQRWYRIIRL